MSEPRAPQSRSSSHGRSPAGSPKPSPKASPMEKVAPWGVTLFLPGTQRSDDEEPTQVRLLDRDAPFKQSTGVYKINRVIHESTRQSLQLADWFHYLLEAPTWKWFFVIIAMYHTLFFLGGVAFYLVPASCNIGLDTFMGAVYFSMETMMTIGYGTNDVFFHHCNSPYFIESFLVLSSEFMAACVLGAFFARISRAGRREKTIIFSDKAVIREIRGNYYFMWQVVELKSTQLSNTKVTLYSVLRDKSGDIVQDFQIRSMRLQHPDDQLGGALLLMLPKVVVHRIDAWSPLFPPDLHHNDAQRQQNEPWRKFLYPDVPQRMSDAEGGNRNAAVCDVCGEAYPTDIMVERHRHYNHEGHLHAVSCNVCQPPTFCGSPELVALHMSQKHAELHKRNLHTLYERNEHWSVGPRPIYQDLNRPSNFNGHPRSQSERERDAFGLDWPFRPEAALSQLPKPQPFAAESGPGSPSAALPSPNSSPNLKTARDDTEGNISSSFDPFEPTTHRYVTPQLQAEVPLTGGNSTARWAKTPQQRKAEREQLRRHFQDCELEIIAIIEGEEPIKSDSLQARHSWSYRHGDIVFDSMFAKCVSKGADGRAEINYNKFHDLVPCTQSVPGDPDSPELWNISATVPSH